jgi:Peroxiredoxin
MELIAFLIRAVMAAVFAIAAIAKIGGYRSSRGSLEEFGVRPQLSKALAIVLPIAELTVAVLLMVPRLATIGALAALTLVCIFTTAILYNLILGRRPECNCFGQIHSSPIGSATLVRNAFLAVGAILLTIPSFGITVGISIIIVFTIVLILALLARTLARQRDILERISEHEDRSDNRQAAAKSLPDTLPLGSPAPEFSLQNIDGGKATLKDILAGGRTSVLIFLSNNCGPCVALMPSISRWHRNQSRRANLVVIGKSSEDGFRKRLGKLKADWILLDGEKQISKAYRVTMSPAAVLIRPDGSIGSAVAFGETEITSLVEHAENHNSVIQDATR